MIARLELAPTREFPNGSPGRSYILRLPLRANGSIDEADCAASPKRATVRRFWPNEADQSGYVVRHPKGWAFSYSLAEHRGGDHFQLEDHPLICGSQLMITEQSGECLPYRVVSLTED